ncbi:MAG: hypothetical protein O6834_03315, partial [Actinobacteria bacterium]|nr:hypothetical protein [Actinomycetota bacterium]
CSALPVRFGASRLTQTRPTPEAVDDPYIMPDMGGEKDLLGYPPVWNMTVLSGLLVGLSALLLEVELLQCR